MSDDFDIATILSDVCDFRTTPATTGSDDYDRQTRATIERGDRGNLL